MPNATLDRIRGQIAQINVQNFPLVSQLKNPTIILSPPVSLDEFRKQLEEILKEQAIIVPAATGEYIFNSIYDFVAWYVDHKESFTPAQRVPLDTIVMHRQGIEQGCECRRLTREALAGDYFKDFWTKNRGTDLVPALLKALNVERVKISWWFNFP